ncbi:uncharacterized [Tachysurus ichikawai]
MFEEIFSSVQRGRSEGSTGVIGCGEEILSNQAEWSLLSLVVYLCDYRPVPQPVVSMLCLRTQFISSFILLMLVSSQPNSPSFDYSLRFTSLSLIDLFYKRLCKISPLLYTISVFQCSRVQTSLYQGLILLKQGSVIQQVFNHIFFNEKEKRRRTLSW